ncbi:unnamed protein product [Urochloa decumbens]|uniref:Uncharacterized protein n=1 Tax=Urochloa decumbens TaxID=240449 RepID=A0ABC9GD69_9POAL
MALLHVARRVGIPALRLAPASRLSSAVGSGPLASRSSQVGYSNGVGKATKKGNIAGKEKDSRDEIFEALCELKESLVATRVAIEAARRRRKIVYRGLTAGVVGVTMYTISCILEEERERRREILRFLSEE